MTDRMTRTALRRRDAALVWDSRMINVLGFAVQEALPVPGVPSSLAGPFILVHEARIRGSELAGGIDTRHPHRGFANRWYTLRGTASTGHSTGPGALAGFVAYGGFATA